MSLTSLLRSPAAWCLGAATLLGLPSEAASDPARASCLVYGVAQTGPSDSQLFTVDLRGASGSQTVALGSPHPMADLLGLAVHPGSGVLYAVSGKQGNLPGHLFQVDGKTGVLTDVGNTGFLDLSGLSFRGTQTTASTWVKNVGLVQLDPQTAHGTIELASDIHADHVAWSMDATVLYASAHKELWKSTAGGPLQALAGKLPGTTQGLTIRPDGQLLGVLESNAALSFFVFNAGTQQTVSSWTAPSLSGKVVAVTWDPRCGNPSPSGAAPLITNVTLDKTTLCPGDDVMITVSTEHPEGPPNRVDVTINGLIGAERAMQFPGLPGTRLIHVAASTQEMYTDSEAVTVEVVDCPLVAAAPPTVYVRGNPYHEHTIDFGIDLPPSVFTSYHWDFGDGTSVDTDRPFVSHDYAASVGRDEPYAIVQAQVTVHRFNLPDIVVRKTMAAWNIYASDKSRGHLRPPSRWHPTVCKRSGKTP